LCKVGLRGGVGNTPGWTEKESINQLMDEWMDGWMNLGGLEIHSLGGGMKRK
jgi:hypothetical protein